jgi:transposase InsO family protein
MASSAKPLPMPVWHDRLSYLGGDNIRKLEGMANGIAVKRRDELGECGHCQVERQARHPSHKPKKRAKKVLRRVHTELCGPITPQSVGGARYFTIFVNEATEMTHINFLKDKASETVNETFKEYKNLVENELNRKIKRVRSDNGGEYIGAPFKNYLKKHGIKHKLKAPYSPEQNGVS